MTMNVAQGNTVTFILEFQDSAGNITQGLGVVFSISQNGAVIFSQTLSYLGVIGYYYTVQWSVGTTPTGYATYALTAGNATIPVADPNLRITPATVIL